MGKMKAGPVVSDNGNFIIDAPFPESMMKDPVEVSTASLFDIDLADGSYYVGSRCSPV
jgi:ribose 5-phosphate isomerase A